MRLEQLIAFFTSNPSAKLLRADQAAYIICFLNIHFKEGANLATPHSVLVQQLNLFLDDLHETEPDVLISRGESYLNQWSTGTTRWLRRYYDASHDEAVYQLTPHTEDVFQFLTEVLERTIGFVGTESRLSRIIETLSDLVIRGSSDPQRRLEHLRKQRQQIDQEIQSIKSGDVVSTHSPTAIRERFADVVADLKSLQGDFRAVEESFKEITRDVQKQQTQAADSRGTILGFALDAEDRLKEGDQGASFQAFVKLILSETQQDKLERMIALLDDIEELAAQVDGRRRMKRMISSLSAEAEKVLRTTRRLSETLKRLLDSRASTSRQRLAMVLREIQSAAVRLAENPPDYQMYVSTDLDLLNIHQRSFWEAPVRFDDVELSNEEPDEDDRIIAFRQLAGMQRLDWDGMRLKVSKALEAAERTTLTELLNAYPPTAGSIEILGYIQLAHDDGHEVDAHQTDIVDVSRDNGDREPYEIPRVTFLSERERVIRSQLTKGGPPS